MQSAQELRRCGATQQVDFLRDHQTLAQRDIALSLPARPSPGRKRLRIRVKGKTSRDGFMKLLHFLDEKFEEVIGVLLLTVVVSLIFIGVVLRLSFNTGLPWQEELSRMLYVVVVYLGASYGMRSQDHIRVVMAFNILPAGFQKILRVVTDMIWLFFNIVIILYALKVHHTMTQFPGYSAVLQIPMHYVFFIVPFGFFLMSLRLIQDYVKLLIGKRGGIG
jgi:TRAP-type C4-dicarboxylate transport system permease small subunit